MIPVIYFQKARQQTRSVLRRKLHRVHNGKLEPEAQQLSQGTQYLIEPPSVQSQLQDIPSGEEAEGRPQNSALIGIESINETELEDIGVGENFAIMCSNGTFEILDDHQNREQQSYSHYHSVLMLEDGYAESSRRDDDQIMSQIGSEDFIPSDSETFDVDSVTSGPLSPSHHTIYDSMEVIIEQDVMIFIDRAAIMSNCKSPTTTDFRLCVRTLIVHKNGSPTFILKEPCSADADGCNHLSVHTCFDILSGQETPCSLRVSLRQGPISTSGSGDHPSQEPLKIWAHEDCNDRSLRTLILSEEGARKRYATKTRLEIDSVFGNYDDEARETGDDTYAESVGSTSIDADSSEPTLNGQTRNGENGTDETQFERGNGTGNEAFGGRNANDVKETNSGIRNFSRMPCLFCGEDALRPMLDAAGGVELLILTNQSFGYTCARCKKRTWVSGMKFGLTLVGAGWTWRQ